ncbi:MAG: CMGC protein kinase [Amphiamblys sp. WSBS2006]|nr:MAG: CMGC protein kinase [Amphiamblys sp. WSBS2006]
MTRNCLKHLVLFFLSGSAIVCAAGESTVDTDSTPLYKEEDYEKVGDLGEGDYGTVSKIREKKTGKIYALKTFPLIKNGYLYAKDEINALKQLDHENIIKIVACSDMRNRREEYPAHLVLEYMPSDLDAVLNRPEIKENRREILRQILEGVAHIHSKKLAHRDIRPENILIDPTTMSVKICDFGRCCKVKGETYHGSEDDWYHRDVLDVVYLMAHLYLGRSFEYWLFLQEFKIDDIERVVKAKESGVILDSRVRAVYEKMQGVISENGLDLFLQLLASERIGGCTVAVEALKHPFFTEGRKQDPLPEEPNNEDAQDTPMKEPKNGGCSAKTGARFFLMQGLKLFLVSCLA